MRYNASKTRYTFKAAKRNIITVLSTKFWNNFNLTKKIERHSPVTIGNRRRREEVGANLLKKKERRKKEGEEIKKQNGGTRLK